VQNNLEHDLSAILEQGALLWPDLKGARFFITGGTGFIGTWLLESLVWLNDHLNLDIQAVVLTRKADSFASKAPHIAAHPSITLLTGDIRTFAFLEGRYTFVIHGATDASAKLNTEDPIRMFDTIVEGTRRALDFAVQSGAKNFLFLSSGAVYGDQPPHISHWSESDLNGPDCTNAGSAYAEGKRAAELLCTLYSKQNGIEAKIARCFAFVGPYLPIDSHFAIGNFIRDAIAKKPIHISGDGTPYRSYLYAADLTLWLWTILLCGQTARPYNVGASQAISIAKLAETVNKTLGGNGINIMQQPQAGAIPKRYIPSVLRAEVEFGLTKTVTLEEAIIKTARWYGWEQNV
jgi:nucleoside-diphosphate-sugar epimerase